MTRAKFFGAAFLCLAGCFPNDSFACGVKCVCNQPSTKQVTCVNANPTCDDSITVRVTSTSYTSGTSFTPATVQCCRIPESTLDAGSPARHCGGSTEPTSVPLLRDRLSDEVLPPVTPAH